MKTTKQSSAEIWEAKARTWKARAEDLERERETAEAGTAEGIKKIKEAIEEAERLTNALWKEARHAKGDENQREAWADYHEAKSEAQGLRLALRIYREAYEAKAGRKPPEAATLDEDARNRAEWAKRLKKAIQTLGISQTVAAEKMGLTFPTVNRILHGYHAPYYTTQEKIKALEKEAAAHAKAKKAEAEAKAKKELMNTKWAELPKESEGIQE